MYLNLYDIEQRHTKPASSYPNGFVERFIRTIKQEFKDMHRRKLYRR